ncbi:IS200/IS605 family transposase [Deltaproteobacteria bacterium TL4]
MSQSLSKILLHLVFSTKNRIDMIPTELLHEVHAYLATVCRTQESEAFRVGGTGNHVHIACTLPRTLTVSKLLEEIKKSSSLWIKQRDARCSDFSWQAGYGAFSLGQSQLDSLIRYIDTQREHHQKMTFQEELLELLRKYNVAYDEKYLWD